MVVNVTKDDRKHEDSVLFFLKTIYPTFSYIDFKQTTDTFAPYDFLGYYNDELFLALDVKKCNKDISEANICDPNKILFMENNLGVTCFIAFDYKNNIKLYNLNNCELTSYLRRIYHQREKQYRTDTVVLIKGQYLIFDKNV